jgi:3-hydroxyacyl-[acyl-carrier-protein] dehydratase
VFVDSWWSARLVIMRWMWIDRILALEKGACCVAVKNVSLAEDYLHDHFPGKPTVPAPLMIEGMAQTAGILVGHARDFDEKVILAKIGKATFDRDVHPGHTLLYEATLDRIDDAGAATTGLIKLLDPIGPAPDAARNEAMIMGRVDLMFSHIDRNRAGLAFPEHNFVFTEPFFNLLRNSGFGVGDG